MIRLVEGVLGLNPGDPPNIPVVLLTPQGRVFTQAMAQEARETILGPSLKGDLAQIGLAALLTMVEMERKTGVLTLKNGAGSTAQILVRTGRVVHARLDDRPEPVDAECVYYLLAWSTGGFELVTCEVEGVDRVQTSTMNLLLEGARRLDESSQHDLSI